jgi:DNA-binding NtrC family response regulator
MKYSILIVDDEKEFGNSFSKILIAKGYNAFFTADPLTVNSIMNNQEIDLIIMDIRMPKLGGIDLLKIVKKDRREIPIIMVTGYPSVDSAVQSMR